jgi:hypothetical protein
MQGSVAQPGLDKMQHQDLAQSPSAGSACAKKKPEADCASRCITREDPRISLDQHLGGLRHKNIKSQLQRHVSNQIYH